MLGFNPPLPPGTPFSTVRSLDAQGTMSCQNTTAVVGTGTNFTSQAAVGDYMFCNGSLFMITAIADDTHLTVTCVMTNNGFR